MSISNILDRYKKMHEYINSSAQLSSILSIQEKMGWKCIKLIGTTKKHEFYLIFERLT